MAGIFYRLFVALPDYSLRFWPFLIQDNRPPLSKRVDPEGKFTSCIVVAGYQQIEHEL